MTAKRVYELAKELKMSSSKELMRLLEQVDVEVKSHMSVLSDQDIKKVFDRLEELRQPAAAPEPEKPAGPKPQTASAGPRSNTPGNQRPGANRQAPQTASAGPRSNTPGNQKPGANRQAPQTRPAAKKPADNHGGGKSYPNRAQGQAAGYGQSKNKKQQNRGRGRRPALPLSTSASIKKIEIGDEIVVQDLARKLGVNGSQLVKKLMTLGTMASINQTIDADTATLLAQDYDISVTVKSERELLEIKDQDDSPAELQERPPVVTVMGHVDHGKTSILDAIRKSKVTATEAGGITQQIGAYQVENKGKLITFIDTPGHEAFTAMRARGAQVTDLSVLVVAADEGVMPQTVEAINHARAAEVPILVAVNKMDRPGANPERIKQQLTEYGLVPEEWGGETIFVEVSAVTKQGLDQLLDMILLVAEVAELKANPDRPAKGIVLEAKLDRGRGPVATVLVQKGTLKVGDIMVAGTTYGRVRAMSDFKGDRVQKASPSTPVEVQGLTEVPAAGDIFQVVADEKEARSYAVNRQNKEREETLSKTTRINLENLFESMSQGEVKELNIVLKGDTQGSLEALKSSLEKLSNEEVEVKVIHSGVGAITETDVMLAAASGSIIIGFNVRPDGKARKIAENEKIDIHTYRVIYEAIDDVRAAFSGLLEPEIKEEFQGRAEVRAIFKVPKAGTVAGSYVLDGKVTNSSLVRVIREGIVIHEGKIDSLKRFKNDVKEVAEGFECGIGIERFNDLKEGDILEFYILNAVQRTI